MGFGLQCVRRRTLVIEVAILHFTALGQELVAGPQDDRF